MWVGLCCSWMEFISLRYSPIKFMALSQLTFRSASTHSSSRARGWANRWATSSIGSTIARASRPSSKQACPYWFNCPCRKGLMNKKLLNCFYNQYTCRWHCEFDTIVGNLKVFENNWNNFFRTLKSIVVLYFGRN